MKQLLLSIFVLLTMTTSCSKPDNGENDDLKKPKNLYEVTINESVINNITGNYDIPYLKNCSRYDINGNMIYNNIPFWSDITNWWVDYETNYKYNSDNNLIEKTHLSNITQYTYNDSKLLIEEKYHVGLLAKSVITYTYEEGRIVRSDEHDISFNWHYYTTYEYNTQGLLRKKTKYKKTNDEFDTADSYEYDNHGNVVIAQHWYSSTSSYKTINVNYTYNSNGSINTITDLGADVYFDGVQKKSTYFYSENNQLIKVETRALQSGNPISVQTYEYLYK